MLPMGVSVFALDFAVSVSQDLCTASIVALTHTHTHITVCMTA